MTRTPVGILISGGGSNMVELVRSMTNDHPGTPKLVLSNRPDANGLERARSLGVPAACVDHRGRSKVDFEGELEQHLNAAGVEVLCLAGFMRLLSPEFVARWEGRILNIHPSLLPLFKGLDTHARALAEGVAVHGCTVHEVTAALDAGPIRGQAVVRVLAGDTPEVLADRVLAMEHRLYPAILRAWLNDPNCLVSLLDA
ncbi:MAG: phosphoribosylglycinamide formyltransferase [Pseudomonadota bacterium]